MGQVITTRTRGKFECSASDGKRGALAILNGSGGHVSWRRLIELERHGLKDKWTSGVSGEGAFSWLV